jgi:outer membrane protein OmpA-like peptidoglycan-associated protein/tetratricopeptide (TPR) repeat protein
MNIIKTALLLLFLVSSYSLFTQEGFKYSLAEKHFKNGEYITALNIYEELADKKKTNSLAIRRVAQCHSYLRNYDRALKLYRKLENLKGFIDQDYLNYAKLLQRKKQYDIALLNYKKYLEKKPDNKLAKSYASQPKYKENLYKDSLNYSIMNSYNSEFSEFSPVLYQNDTIYATNNRNTSIVNTKYSRDNSYFIHLDSKSNKELTKELIKHTSSSKYHNGPITFNSTEKTMFLTRNDATKKNKSKIRLKLYTSTMKDGKWSEFTEIKLSDTSYSIGHAVLDKADSIIYFSSDMPGGFGNTDIWKATIQNGKIGTPINLGGKINTEGDELFPYITDNNHLIYSSDGLVGLGGLDLFFAVNSNGNFLKSQNMGYPLNSSQDDFGIYLNEKEKSGLFSSDRSEEKTSDDLYLFKYKKLPFNEELIICKTYNQDSILISNITIKTYKKTPNENWGLIDSTHSNKNGEWIFKYTPDSEYRVDYSSPIYENENVSLSNIEELSLIKEKILIKNNTGGKITDGITGRPIKKALVTLYTKDSNGEWIETDIAITDELGTWNFDFRDDFEYKIDISADNYKSLDVEFPSGDFNNLRLTPRTNEGSIIRIDNIYFDHASAKIQTQSFPILKNIVSFLNENPDITIELSAHTSCIGSDSYNLKLSKKRAKNCREHLIDKGVKPSRVQAKGYGESQNLNKCKLQRTNEAAAKLNRRVELKVI